MKIQSKVMNCPPVPRVTRVDQVKQIVMSLKRPGEMIRTDEVAQKASCRKCFATVVRKQMIQDGMVTEDEWPNLRDRPDLKVRNFHLKMEGFCVKTLEVLPGLKGKSRAEIDQAVAAATGVSPYTVVKIRAKLIRERRIIVEDWPTEKNPEKRYGRDGNTKKPRCDGFFEVNPCRIRIMCWATQTRWEAWRQLGFESYQEWEASRVCVDRISRVIMDRRVSKQEVD